MFNMDWWQSFTTWLATQTDAILNALNPINAINGAGVWVANLLPAPSADIDTTTQTVVAAFNQFLDTISWFDYFINLPFLITVIGFIASIELSLNVYRTWRIIRSAIT